MNTSANEDHPNHGLVQPEPVAAQPASEAPAVELPPMDETCEAEMAHAATLETGEQSAIVSLTAQKKCRERQLLAAQQRIAGLEQRAYAAKQENEALDSMLDWRKNRIAMLERERDEAYEAIRALWGELSSFERHIFKNYASVRRAMERSGAELAKERE